MTTWYGEGEADIPKVSGTGWGRVAVRGLLVGATIILGLILTMLLRPIEGLFWGLERRLTGRVTVIVCRLVLTLIGLRRNVIGAPSAAASAFVANHSSWLDIFVLNAGAPLYFVSKSEVSTWPGIGVLARITGTEFIQRARRDSEQQRQRFEARLTVKHRLLFFPEGTSTDGRRVLPFKSTLFAAFFAETLPTDTAIQPISVVYRAAKGTSETAYGWWGDMGFAQHLLYVLSLPKQGEVTVIYHPVQPVRDYSDRKALARSLEAQVRHGLSQGLGQDL